MESHTAQKNFFKNQFLEKQKFEIVFFGLYVCGKLWFIPFQLMR